MTFLSLPFFNRDACTVAQDLIGKVLYHRPQNIWLSAMIIETEAYEKQEKGSHASLGWTEKRSALFMPAGTIYMYYARGGDSFNVSCRGEGNAVLLKSGWVYEDEHTSPEMLATMQQLNPQKNSPFPRPVHRLCGGQTLFCKALGLKVPQWDQQSFDREKLFIKDVGYRPQTLIQTYRLGIPAGRDEHLLYRFIDFDKKTGCTSNPLTQRKWQEGRDFHLLKVS